MSSLCLSLPLLLSLYIAFQINGPFQINYVELLIQKSYTKSYTTEIARKIIIPLSLEKLHLYKKFIQKVINKKEI